MQVLEIFEYESGGHVTYTIGGDGAPKVIVYAIELKHNGIEFSIETDTLDARVVYEKALAGYQEVQAKINAEEARRAKLESELHELVMNDLSENKRASIWTKGIGLTI